MQYKFFIIPFGDDGSAEEELNQFLRGHHVTQTERHFSFERGCWAFLVEYLEGDMRPYQKQQNVRKDMRTAFCPLPPFSSRLNE